MPRIIRPLQVYQLVIHCCLFTQLAGFAADSTAPAAPVATEPVAPPQFADNRMVLTAEQSTGGHLMKTGEGKVIGVTLDKSCAPNFKNIPGFIEWKLTSPLPAGWWHATVKSNAPAGYANREIAVMLMSEQKPSVVVAPNFINWDKGTPQVFECWIYTSTTVASVRMQATSDLWNWNFTWPVSQITLEHRDPAALAAADAITMDLPAKPDGTIPLPTALPAGIWAMSGVTSTPGAATMEVDGGRTIQTTFGIDRWKTTASRGVNFYADTPLRKITFSERNLFKSVLLKHYVTRPAKSIATDGKLMTVLDPAKPESGQLVMIGTNLSGEAPSLPLLPKGLKTAVLTTWDDGAPEDIRCAEILNKYGYHPSFFFNQNSAGMKFMDQLEALNVEIGAHCYHHPSLYAIAPKTAVEECVEMRKLLETTLQHPVISFGYPNGYTPAWDVDGDYVVRAVKTAGFWSGRTTRTKAQTVDDFTDLTTMDPDGFFGNAKALEQQWALTRTKEGGVFYFWGHSWQIGKTEEHWKKFEDFVAQFARQADAWYPSQGEFSLWLWQRQNLRFTVAGKTRDKVAVTLTRPRLHPYLAAKCPLTLKTPAGVQKVLWKGKEIPVTNGMVDLAW